MCGYIDDYEPKCYGCKHHEIVMCDADMNASYCNDEKCYCSSILSCENWKKEQTQQP